jgi:hypothetical protein
MNYIAALLADLAAAIKSRRTTGYITRRQAPIGTDLVCQIGNHPYKSVRRHMERLQIERKQR